MTEMYARQKDLVNAEIFKTPICLIGLGGIGSFTALTLGKMGFRNLNIWDMDEVNVHNLPNQFYGKNNLGQNKAFATERMLLEFADSLRPKTSYGVAWNTRHRLKGMVVMAVDSISVRDEIYQHILDNNKVLGFVDGRMGGQQAEVYTINPWNKNDMKFFASRLWAPEDIEPLSCTERAIIYNVCWIASAICNQIRLYLEGKIYKRGIIMDFENMDMIDISQTKVVKNGAKQTVSRL